MNSLRVLAKKVLGLGVNDDSPNLYVICAHPIYLFIYVPSNLIRFPFRKSSSIDIFVPPKN